MCSDQITIDRLLGVAIKRNPVLLEMLPEFLFSKLLDIYEHPLNA